MQDQILRVINYFALFSFPPSLDEIYTFLETPTTKKQLHEDLHYLVKKGILIHQNLWVHHEKVPCFTLPHRSFLFQVRVQREIISLQKLERIENYLKLISLLPQIQFVGLSGSISMSNTTEDDDIDLFIITSHERIWTARFFALIAAQVMGLRGKYNVNKVCLNMWFDEYDIEIPLEKRNEYVAHELFQLKSYVNKCNMYEKLLTHNKWAYAFFPNIVRKKAYRRNLSSKTWKFIFDLVEVTFKKIQLKLLNRRKTQEVITDTQLWLIKEDFEKKIPLKLKRL